MSTPLHYENRIVLKVGGESGQGVNSVGEILAKAIKRCGYKVFGYREYPSLIKGGYASYQIDVADQLISSSLQKCHLLIGQSRLSVHKYLRDLVSGGILVHSIDKLSFDAAEQEFIDQNQIQVVYLDTFKVAEAQGGNKLMSNMVLVGYLSKLININYEVLAQIVSEIFADKPKLLEIDLKCLDAGAKLLSGPEPKLNLNEKFHSDPNWKDSLVISGNHSLALGSLAAGTRAYYGYPMTPSSSLLSYVAEISHETKALVKQAEDEITAVQMAFGSMFMGTRALVATSGGGFDLMTETVSLAGITENPLVIFLAQRPGPATGLPTWTASADLNLAIYAGHGEFPRCVIAASDADSAYLLIQHAFNIAEEFQIPVMIMSEKQIAESLYNIGELPGNIEIKRGLIPANSVDRNVDELKLERYATTETGVSPRWLPGTFKHTYVVNSDEHLADGTLTEEAEPVIAMHNKRMRKLETLRQQLPEPKIYGDNNSDTLFVGWGSVKSALLDALPTVQKSGQSFAYLHFEYLYPLRTELLEELIVGMDKKYRRVILIENNSMGQLGNLITQETGYKFNEKLLKFDGRPFFVDDIVNYINSNNELDNVT